MYYIKEKSPFEIRWHINIVNSSVSLADAKLLLVLKTVRGNYDITDYIEDIVDNVIRVKLASLTFVGDYSLYLKIQSDSFEEVSLLERFAFRVVKDNDPSVIVDVVELSSDIYVKSYAYDSALSSGSTNAVQNAVLTEALADKQETINDLEDIRSGANKGATALQDVPEEYITETELALLLNNKVDKEEGKGLSTNDYTTAEKNKLASLENYDDSELLTKLAQLDNAKASKGDVEELVEELESNAVLIEDLQNTKIDKEADDYYPQLSVGLADNLAGEDVVASEISFRKSGGGAISDGVARIEAIKGNSVVWNQLALSQGAKGSYDNSAGNSTIYWQSGLDVNYTERINGHKVFISVIDRIGVIPIFYCADKIQLNLLTGLIVTANTTQQDRNGIIAQVPAGVNASWDIDCLFVDLTQMFGVGNEPSTIEEFYQRIPMGVDLYAYNEGEVIHMNAQSLVSCNVDSTICKEQSLDVVRKYFPDGMKSTDTDSDAIRYNKVTNSWEKHIAIKSIKLKDLSWTHVSELGYFFSSPIDARQGNIDGTNISCICEQYQPMSWIDFVSNYMNAKLKSVALYTHPNGEVRVNVCDTEPADVASFLASLTDDDVLYYSAKEPIVTELDDDFNLDYEVWNGGTEKIVSELPTAPLKADIAYGFNAVGKIKELEEKINSGGGGGVSKEYVDSKVTELSAEVGKKQDTITDLETIRSGAEKGATALQSVPDTYATKDYVDQKVGQGGGGGGGGSTADLTAVAKWGVLTQTLKKVGNNNEGYVVQVSNPVYGWIPQSFIDEVTEFGGLAPNAISGSVTNKPIFNADTGYFEYNGIVNLAYDEMRAAYITGRNMFSNSIANYLYAVQYRDNILSGVANKLRCILHYPIFTEMGHYRFHGFCQYLNFLERGIYNNDFGKILVIASGLNLSFNGCQTLRECGYFDVAQCTSTPPAFSGNPSLEKVYLSGLKVNVNFSASPLLKEECVLYMIQKAGATGITITLHPTAYDRAMADAEIVAAMESKQVNLAKA